MLSLLLSLFLIAIAYLLGSICSAIVVCKLFSLPDPRTEGSQNPGATNVLRLAGKKYAALVLAGDLLKGLFPVLLAKLLGVSFAVQSLVGLVAVIGHIYPLFFDFKGGKGVATALGVLLGLHFLLGIAVIAVWLLVAKFTRYSSLASMISLILAPFFAIVAVRGLQTFIPLMFMTILILYKHKNNIERLMNGTEPKIEKNRQLVDVASELLKDKPQEKVNPSEDVK